MRYTRHLLNNYKLKQVLWFIVHHHIFKVATIYVQLLIYKYYVSTIYLIFLILLYFLTHLVLRYNQILLNFINLYNKSLIYQFCDPSSIPLISPENIINYCKTYTKFYSIFSESEIYVYIYIKVKKKVDNWVCYLKLSSKFKIEEFYQLFIVYCLDSH